MCGEETRTTSWTSISTFGSSPTTESDDTSSSPPPTGMARPVDGSIFETMVPPVVTTAQRMRSVSFISLRLKLYVGFAYDLAPFLNLGADELAVFFGRAAAGLRAQCSQLLLHFGLLQDDVDLFVQLFDDGWRRTSRRGDPVPRQHVEIRQARFFHR